MISKSISVVMMTFALVGAIIPAGISTLPTAMAQDLPVDPDEIFEATGIVDNEEEEEEEEEEEDTNTQTIEQPIEQEIDQEVDQSEENEQEATNEAELKQNQQQDVTQSNVANFGDDTAELNAANIAVPIAVPINVDLDEEDVPTTPPTPPPPPPVEEGVFCLSVLGAGEIFIFCFPTMEQCLEYQQSQVRPEDVAEPCRFEPTPPEGATCVGFRPEGIPCDELF